MKAKGKATVTMHEHIFRHPRLRLQIYKPTAFQIQRIGVDITQCSASMAIVPPWNVVKELNGGLKIIALSRYGRLSVGYDHDSHCWPPNPSRLQLLRLERESKRSAPQPSVTSELRVELPSFRYDSLVHLVRIVPPLLWFIL